MWISLHDVIGLSFLRQAVFFYLAVA